VSASAEYIFRAHSSLSKNQSHSSSYSRISFKKEENGSEKRIDKTLLPLPGGFAADTGFSGTAGAERRLLALKTKHPVIHCRSSPSAF
jgi:hypothetical protein